MISKDPTATDRRAAKRFARRLMGDSGLAGLGVVLSRLSIFAISVLVGRTLGRDLFGLFAAAMLLVQVVYVFTSVGLSQVASREIATRQGNDRGRAIRSFMAVSIAFGLVGAAVAAVLGQAIASHLGLDFSNEMMAVVVVLVGLQVIQGLVEGILRGAFLYRWLPAAALAGGLSGGLAALLLVPRAAAKGGLVAVLVLVTVQIVVYGIALSPQVLGGFLGWNEFTTVLKGTTLPVMIAALAWNAAMLIPPLYLGRSPEGLGDLASWTAATQVRFFVTFVPLMVVNTSIPHLADAESRTGIGRREIRIALGLPAAAAVVAYLCVVAAARPIMGLYGQEFSDTAALLVIVSTFALVQVVGSAFYGLLLSLGSVWFAASVNVLWAIIVLLSGPQLALNHGAQWLAALYAISAVPLTLLLGLRTLRSVRTSLSASRA